MKAKTRPYKVTDIENNKVRVIEASTIAEVARYIIKSSYVIAPCSGMDGLRLIAEGVELESAVAKAEEI